MKIKLHEILVKDLCEGYLDNQEDGVAGYGGKLNIRPPFQREFVYNDTQRNEVIKTVINNFPLNIMYWVVNENNRYEVLDGQQRTISICRYVTNMFSVIYNDRPQLFANLPEDIQEQILNYKLFVYFCEGTDSEKLAWFKIVNVAGAVLTEQELRNAVYTGTWLSDAKRWFSKTGCAAYDRASKYVSGSPIRQDFLETAIKWISNNEIENYMSAHQHDKDAQELWQYFESVIQWVKTTFTVYRKEMKGVEWGSLFNCFKDKQIDAAAVETQIKTLMMDDDVTKKSGIYEYVLSGGERCLNIRAFTDTMKRSAYERQNNICPYCKQPFDIDKMEGDHITPWSQGGKTIAENCQMLCKDCNRRKAGR